jgi:uncharacterized protein YcaQ
MTHLLTLTPTTARRLAIHAQRLSGQPGDMLETIRALGCLQLDPTSIIAKNHQIVLFSRLGAYDPAEFERLMWGERHLFEYWAHAASIVLTENYPIHNGQMRAHQEGDSAWLRRLRAWAAENQALREHIFSALRERGPLALSEIGGKDKVGMTWVSGGWTSERTGARMLDYLWQRGEVLIHSRRGQNRLWHVAEAVLPGSTPRETLTHHESTRRAVQISLRALGVATPQQIKVHFVRGFYPALIEVLNELEREGVIQRVRIRGEDADWKGTWYIHREDMPLAERIAAGEWEGRTTLLSPFDNLICDRRRTEQMWDFYFRLEIYTPKAKRQYGYFVMPVLHGDRLIGRIDPAYDRKAKRLTVHAQHWEPGTKRNRTLERTVSGAVEALAAWLGAREINMP